MAGFEIAPGNLNFRLTPTSAAQLTGQQVLIVQAIDAGTYFHTGEKFVGDGTTAAFTLSSTPNPASSVQAYVNDFRQTGGGKDYSVAGAVVTFNQAPSSGSIILFDYRVTP